MLIFITRRDADMATECCTHEGCPNLDQFIIDLENVS